MKPSKTSYEDIISASDSSLLKGTLTEQEQILFQMPENPRYIYLLSNKQHHTRNH